MEDHRGIVRLLTVMLLVVAVLCVVLLVVGCTRRIDVHTDTRCETPGSVILDNNDYACWLAQEAVGPRGGM